MPLPGRPAHSVTAMGNAQVSTTQVKFGTGSYTNYNDLSGYLNVTPYSDFAFGRSSFTVEFWYYPTTLANQSLFGTRPYATNSTNIALFMYNSASIGLYVQGYKITTSTKIVANTWQSIALVRNGTSTSVYINGTSAGTWATDTTNYTAGSCIFGSDDYFPGGTQAKGYLDEIRISNIARYTGNYTPATQPFVNDSNTLLLVHCDGTNGSKTFVDDNT